MYTRCTSHSKGEGKYQKSGPGFAGGGTSGLRATGRRGRADLGRSVLLWPPTGAGGYSLIVDGVRTAAEDGMTLEIVPTRAVRHRRGDLATSNNAVCQSDCIPIRLS